MKSRSRATPSWSVGELADRFDLAPHVLRHWEDVGLLAPDRDGAGRRRYGREDATRVAVILTNKAAGMGLDQIKVLLDAEAPGRHALLDAHLADLEERMAQMERSREMTRHALRCRAHDVANCPTFRRSVDDLVESGGRFAIPGAEGFPSTPTTR